MKATMEFKSKPSSQKTEAPAKLAWQRPQLKKLRVSLDTMNRPGSGADAFMLTPP